MYIDFHAHATKRGGFMFGNHITDAERQADNITFVKLIAMNCMNFDMNECNFSEKIMSINGKAHSWQVFKSRDDTRSVPVMAFSAGQNIDRF